MSNRRVLSISSDEVFEHFGEVRAALAPILRRKGFDDSGNLSPELLYVHTLALLILAKSGIDTVEKMGGGEQLRAHAEEFHAEFSEVSRLAKEMAEAERSEN